MPRLADLPLASFVFFVVLSGSAALSADNWTGFQGPPAASLEAKRLPLSWSPTENIAWQVELPAYGQSSPVVWDGQIYITSVSGDMKQSCHITAYSLKDGKQLWQKDVKAATEAKNSNYISRAAPTPVADADGIIVLFEGGNLVALAHDGKVRWERNLVEEYGAISARHGLASSIEQDGEHAFVWIERQEEPYVLAVDKSTGKNTWKSEGLGVTSWSSPRLVPVDGGDHLVLSGIGKIAGYDPASGKQLWTFDGISGNSTPTPVPLGNGRFLIGASEGRGSSEGTKAAESNGVIQVELKDGKYAARFLWHADKATSSFGSAVAHEGLAYFVNRAGVIFCLDLETGKEVYAARSAGSVWATPIGVDDRVYFFGRNGTTTVAKAGPKFEELAKNDLWKAESAPAAAPGPPGGGFGGPVLYAAVAVDDQLLLRRGDTLYKVHAK